MQAAVRLLPNELRTASHESLPSLLARNLLESVHRMKLTRGSSSRGRAGATSMAAEGGGRRIPPGVGRRKAPSAGAHGGQLRAGVRLVAAGAKHKVARLVYSAGKVQLNGGGVAILRLCDGSR